MPSPLNFSLSIMVTQRWLHMCLLSRKQIISPPHLKGHPFFHKRTKSILFPTPAPHLQSVKRKTVKMMISAIGHPNYDLKDEHPPYRFVHS